MNNSENLIKEFRHQIQVLTLDTMKALYLDFITKNPHLVVSGHSLTPGLKMAITLIHNIKVGMPNV